VSAASSASIGVLQIGCNIAGVEKLQQSVDVVRGLGPQLAKATECPFALLCLFSNRAVNVSCEGCGGSTDVFMGVSLGHMDSGPSWLGSEPGRKFALPLGLLLR
jgi:hypothetical protein